RCSAQSVRVVDHWRGVRGACREHRRSTDAEDSLPRQAGRRTRQGQVDGEGLAVVTATGRTCRPDCCHETTQVAVPVTEAPAALSYTMLPPPRSRTIDGSATGTAAQGSIRSPYRFHPAFTSGFHSGGVREEGP